MVHKSALVNTFTVLQQTSSVQLGMVKVDGDIIHYILGLIVKLHEIKQIKLIQKHKKQFLEKVGDYYWNIAGLCWKLGILFNPLVPAPLTTSQPFADWHQIEDRLLTIADHYKKYIAENQDFPTGTVDLLIYETLQYLTNICYAYEVEVEQVLEMHIAKTESEYPNGYPQSEEFKAGVVKELNAIKQLIRLYRKRGRPTKAEREESVALTIGETWREKEQYPERRKRKPGPRKNKTVWKRTLEKYKKQKKTRLKPEEVKDD